MLKYIFLIAGLIVVQTGVLRASHVRAGEITAERISGNGVTYRFTLTVFLDEHGTTEALENATMEFGDGSSATTDYDVNQNLGNDVIRREFVFTHTYAGPGTYTVSFTESFRNAGIRNIANSGQNDFYIETTVTANPFLGQNQSPQMNFPPVDEAVTGEKYIHNPGAFDPDGDSISYELVTPEKAPGTDVDNYQSLDNFGGTLSLDSVTGDLVWDAPAEPGEYNVAFRIVEWRNSNRIGSIVRDMQIIVSESPNNAPVLEANKDTCFYLTPGQMFRDTINGFDPDGDDILLTSNVDEIPLDNASFSVLNSIGGNPSLTASPAEGVLEWEPSCSEVRSNPYQFTFKAKDDVPESAPPLVDFHTLRVFVRGPAPSGLSVSRSGPRSMNVQWDTYSCQEAAHLTLWRKPCDSAVFADVCKNTLKPSEYGYTSVATFEDLGATSYVDDKNGEGLAPGKGYCYVLTASFENDDSDDTTVLSAPSSQVCSTVSDEMPVLFNVDVTETDTAQGRVRINWGKPDGNYNEPLTYRILRADSVNGAEDFEYITGMLSDTTYTDTLDTKTQGYRYKIEFYESNGDLAGVSAAASTVRLSATPRDEAAALSWENNVPWTTAFRQHYIYIDSTLDGNFTRFDSSLSERPDPYEYLAENLANCDTFCFYIAVKGSYCNDSLPSPLINRSQKECVVPREDRMPQEPDWTIRNFCDNPSERSCDVNKESPFENRLSWSDLNAGKECPNVAKYRIYFAPFKDSEVRMIAEQDASDTVFVHQRDRGVQGYYAVSAVNAYGRESDTNGVVVDNCPCYKLPNTFSPNGDGVNDRFRPFPYPRFVRNVRFNVYNRWGKQVFATGDNTDIGWRGTGPEGNALPDGVYFYKVEVDYLRYDREAGPEKLKGWIKVIR